MNQQIDTKGVMEQEAIVTWGYVPGADIRRYKSLVPGLKKLVNR